MPRIQIPKLPQLLDRKIYKSGQTRGADDDEIYQNRVSRTNTVLIPFHFWDDEMRTLVNSNYFESGYIVLIKPEEYFTLDEPNNYLRDLGLVLGNNCLVFYETRLQWNTYNPDNLEWTYATQRKNPLGGNYIARVPATTASENGEKINRGFTVTSQKGAGIRQYEYASSETVKKCRIQLEAEYWLCYDSIEAAVEYGMTIEQANARKEYAINNALENDLLDYDRLESARIINSNHETVCPLCLERISGYGFFNRLIQAEGREVPDLTITEINLFHISELKYGSYNHKPYNLGWGHHHCNVVVKDSGIMPTLQWMKKIIKRNEDLGIEINI